MTKRALITGCSGQDGSYLAEYLLSLGYQVHGIVRRHSVAENQDCRLKHLGDLVVTHYGDLLDKPSLKRIVATAQPDEVYNLAAQSHVRISFDMPDFTKKVNDIGAGTMLKVCHELAPKCRFYQASSSEMFGNSCDEDTFQRLTTPMKAISPYGKAKRAAFRRIQRFRSQQGMFAVNGLLFNHESPRRGVNFVTAKVIKRAVEIYRGKEKQLMLGAIDSFRDWGHSKDYVRAMHMMMQADAPSDWIVATGETRTVRQLCEYVFERLNLDYRDYVTHGEPSLLRAKELTYLRGESSRIREELGWEPEYSFETMIDEILQTWLERIPA